MKISWRGLFISNIMGLAMYANRLLDQKRVGIGFCNIPCTFTVSRDSLHD
jgi:hypothetical protein